MDETDRALMQALADDARLPVATLAKRLGIARTAVQSRLERLESSGAIAGYTLRRGPGADPVRIRATVLLQVEPRATPALLSRLSAVPQVERVHTSSGRFDLILLIAAHTTEELDQMLDKIGGFPGVKSSESLIHLSTRIDRAY